MANGRRAWAAHAGPRGNARELLCAAGQARACGVHVRTCPHGTTYTADAAAKSHLDTAVDATMDLRTRVTSRPLIYTMRSDFWADGTLRGKSEGVGGAPVMWDRRLFPGVRKRVRQAGPSSP